MPRESQRARRERMQAEYTLLCEEFPSPHAALNFNSPFQLLVATVLSAQTTDKRVNEVTPALFERFANPAALSAAEPQQVEDIIHPLGFYRTKAAHIIALADGLERNFNGVVPSTMADLTSLPGVGRKTANVVLGNAFNIPGFPVDTHVIRVTGRLRWRADWQDRNPSPEHIESEITACFPPAQWTDLSHRLILHGRAICHARKPNCAACPLHASCPSAFQV